MDDDVIRAPDTVENILRETSALDFNMASDRKVGALLAVLASSKPGGHLLELGTGTGHGTAWLLSGMDAQSRLDTVDVDPAVSAVARRHLGFDRRVTFHIVDGAEFIGETNRGPFDLIYADAWPGKFSHLDQALARLRLGGIYLIDDLLPQTSWPDGHAPNVAALIKKLEQFGEYRTVKLAWASGLMLVVRAAGG